MSQPNRKGSDPEHIRTVLARVAAEHGEHDLAAELNNTATIVRPARYLVPGQDGPAKLVDQDDDAETYHWGDARIECKGTCGKWTHHTIFVEVSGLVDLQARTFAVCRDCQHEQAGEVTHGIGNIQPRRLEAVARQAAKRADHARRARRRAQRDARRRGR